MMWESHDDFVNMLAQTWQEAGTTHTLQELHDKLANVAGCLSEWGVHTFGHVRKELTMLNDKLKRLRSDADRIGGPSHAEIKVVERIMELNHREEIVWKQRSRIMWLTDGDRNTRFFHLRASQRRRRNRISKLKKPDGTVTVNEEEMGAMATDFFRTLYTTEGTTDMDQVLNTIPTKVTAVMSESLMAPFEKDEIKRALFQMFLTKAPRPDGLPAHFFQRH